MPDFAEYLDRLDAVCRRCNVTHDLLRNGFNFIDDGCPACHAPRSVSFAFDVSVKAWLYNDKQGLDMMQRALANLQQYFKASPGAERVPVTINIEQTIENLPNRLLLRREPYDGRLGVVDYPDGTSKATIDEYLNKFGNTQALYEPDIPDDALSLFETVHQFKRTVSTHTEVLAPAPNRPLLDPEQTTSQSPDNFGL